jgi:hypothetical protein
MITNVSSALRKSPYLNFDLLTVDARPLKSGLPPDRGDQRRDEVSDQRRDHGAERRADHDGDREVDEIAAQDELPEALHGRCLLVSRPDLERWSGRHWRVGARWS